MGTSYAESDRVVIGKRKSGFRDDSHKNSAKNVTKMQGLTKKLKKKIMSSNYFTYTKEI